MLEGNELKSNPKREHRVKSERGKRKILRWEGSVSAGGVNENACLAKPKVREKAPEERKQRRHRNARTSVKSLHRK